MARFQSGVISLALIMVSLILPMPIVSGAVAINYTEALSKAILFFECQRSGVLPADQRCSWRGNSGTRDGNQANVDLSKGYYDAGDNVKFGFPMAYTITMLSWATLENTAKIQAAGELENIRTAIRWGTDFFLSASSVPYRLWVGVGDGIKDHECWERPETMDTPRTLYQINASTPGSEVAAETAAALAAASMVFASVDPVYSAALLNRSVLLFHFADQYRASFTAECPFYCSYTGYNDELMWAASWLLKASVKRNYLSYIRKNMYTMTLNATEFSWDNKYAGYAVLLSKRFFLGDTSMLYMKQQAEHYLCANLPGNSQNQVQSTPGGFIFVRTGSNSQYAGAAGFLAATYAGYLKKAGVASISCGNRDYTPKNLMSFAKVQVDYILGKNPLNYSYMVGYGSSYPVQAHHRGSSIPTTYSSPTQCNDGFPLFLYSSDPNPNVAFGAIVGGPDQNDAFQDIRSNFQQLEPCTYINALFVGLIARFSS